MANQTFTDDPKMAGITSVSAIHFQELKDAINQWTTAYSLPTQVTVTFTDKVSSTVVNQVIAGLNYINVNKSGCTTDTWTSLTNVSSGEIITALKFNTAVANMKVAQNQYCSNCDTATTGYNYSAGACSVCNGCNLYRPCNTCNGGCNTQTCTCNGKCNGNQCADACWIGGGQYCAGCVRPAACDSIGNGYTCTICNASCNLYRPCITCNGCNTDTGPSCTKCYTITNRYPWS